MLGLGFIKSFTNKMYASSFQFSIDKPKESPNSTGFLPKTCGGFLDGDSLSWLWVREARSCHLSLLPSTARVSNALSTWEQDMCRWILHSSLLTQHDRQHHENQEQSSVSKIWANSEKNHHHHHQNHHQISSGFHPWPKLFKKLFWGEKRYIFLLSGMEGSNLEYFINNFWNVICKLAPKQHCNACPPPPRGSHSPKHVFLQHHKCSAQLCCTTIQHQQLYKGREEEGLSTAACLGPL